MMSSVCTRNSVLARPRTSVQSAQLRAVCVTTTSAVALVQCNHFLSVHRQRRRRCPLRDRSRTPVPFASSADAASFGGTAGDEGTAQHDSVSVFPRLKEKDPFKVLGIPDDSDFEEVQQARNYLVSEYREHEASREHIELSYEKIVSQSFRARQKKGYRPGRGKRGERTLYQAPPTIFERIKGWIDTSNSAATIFRDTLIFGIFGLWSGATVPLNTAPLLITFGFAVVRTIQKRTTRTPEGPWLGDSPAIGAVLTNLAGMALATVLASFVQSYFPFWRFDINEYRAGAFMICALLGPFNVFIK